VAAAAAAACVQFTKIHDFARAFGALCWNLSKVPLALCADVCPPAADDRIVTVRAYSGGTGCALDARTLSTATRTALLNRFRAQWRERARCGSEATLRDCMRRAPQAAHILAGLSA
jgi:hypothetical protein